MEEQRTYSKVEWVLYIIVLPLFFTILLSGVILQFLGYNVAGKAFDFFKQVPVVKNVVASDSSKNSGASKEESRQLEQQLADAKNQIAELQRVRDGLLQSQDQKDALISQLRNQIFTIQKQLDDLKAATNKQKADTSVYEQMSPGKAAAILQAMPNQQASSILNQLSSDTKAAILEKMDPVKASQILSP